MRLKGNGWEKNSYRVWRKKTLDFDCEKWEILLKGFNIIAKSIFSHMTAYKHIHDSGYPIRYFLVTACPLIVDCRALTIIENATLRLSWHLVFSLLRAVDRIKRSPYNLISNNNVLPSLILPQLCSLSFRWLQKITI